MNKYKIGNKFQKIKNCDGQTYTIIAADEDQNYILEAHATKNIFKISENALVANFYKVCNKYQEGDFLTCNIDGSDHLVTYIDDRGVYTINGPFSVVNYHEKEVEENFTRSYRKKTDLNRIFEAKKGDVIQIGNFKYAVQEDEIGLHVKAGDTITYLHELKKIEIVKKNDDHSFSIQESRVQEAWEEAIDKVKSEYLNEPYSRVTIKLVDVELEREYGCHCEYGCDCIDSATQTFNFSVEVSDEN